LSAQRGAVPPANASAIAPYEPMKPIVSPEEASEAMLAYQQLCASVLIPWEQRIIRDGVVVQESDYQRIRIKATDPETGKEIYVYKDFPKKSAWRKLARFYSISTEIVEKQREDREDGSWVWHYTVRATAPSGQSQMGEGSCDSREVHGDRRREHDTRGTAHTRAKNRAISDLIGFGQVSAEEVMSPIEPPKRVEAEARVVGPGGAHSEAKPPRSLDELSYKLSEHILDVDGTLTIVEHADGFTVEKKRYLEDDLWAMINAVIVSKMGGEWVSKGKASHWFVPKGA